MDEPIRHIRPEGLTAQLLGVTVFFSAICLVVVMLKIWLRYSDGLIGLEDWLMVLGVAINQAHNGVVIWGTFVGLGTPDDRLTLANMLEGSKVMMYWQLTYVSGSLLIKASICVTLMRISIKRRYNIILIGLITLSAVTTIAAMIVVLIRCKPIAANWNPDLGACLSQDLILVFTYVVSAINIFTDWSAAIMPIFILWNVRMERRVKMVTAGVLGIGIFASVATIIRIPYSRAYSDPVDLLYNVAYVVLWTVVECATGVIAGCLPMLRKLIHGYLGGPKAGREEME